MPSSTTCEAPNVISRSRRRRKQQPASTGSVEKENVIEEQPGVAEDTITKTRSKKTIATTKSTRRTKKPTVKSSTSGSSSKEPSFIWNLSAHETLERSLRTFQSALEKLATEEVNVLKEDESLVKSLVEASFSLSSQREMESSTFLLQEKKKELLSVFRKIVKMVAEDKSKPPESAIQFLCVAVHGLRALLLLSQEVVTNEAILRLLFHALFSASSSISVLSESKTSAKSKKNNLLELFGVAALSTFEAVSVVLRRITLLKDSSGKTKSKECISFKSSNNKIGGSLQFGFPMPGIESSSTNRGYSTSVFQLLTITTQSILALSRVLVALPMTSKGAWASLLLSFKDQGQDQPTKYTITVSLLRQVGLPWVFSMSQYASTKEQSVLLKEGASFCKQGHRILWELASKESKKNPKSEPGVYDECLDLRRHAIALLAGYSGVSSDVAEEFDVGSRIFISYLREKQFANACTLASKATTAYAQQQSPERASAGLTNFHMDVGIAIDRLAGAMEGDESFPYFEYCAYRALHIGPNAWLDDKDESILCSSCQHKNSSKQPCLFSRLPFQYIHHQSLVSPSPQKKNRATLLQESALSLLFLSIQVQKQLNVLLLEKSKENLSMDISMSSQDAAKIVGCFQTLFLPLTSSSIPLTEQLRYFKILSSVQLHSTIFKILSKTASEELVKENENRRIFEIAAEIMTKCAGPFAYSLLQNGDPSIDTKKEAFLSDFVIECYCRSAAVYDALGMADGATYLERSDDIMENIVGILIPDDCSDSYAPPGEHLEKAAKVSWSPNFLFC